MTEVRPLQQRGEWHSLLSTKFEPRPILNDISIVIPTIGRKILEQSLYWIMHGNAWPGCLIIVNQGAEGEINEWLRHIESSGVSVKYHNSSEQGRAAGINRGIKQVDTEFFAITDDDCFVAADWLLNLAEKLKRNPRAIVTGRVEAAGKGVSIVATSMIPAVYHKPGLKNDPMSGGNMGTSLEVVKDVGLFDEDPCMKTVEDGEWSYRALLKKISIIYDPDVCLWHYGWRDSAERKEQYHLYALSHGGFYGKYLRKGDFFILIRSGLHLIRALRRWIRGLFLGDSEQTIIGKTYVMNLIPGILNGVRSKIQPGNLQ